MKKVLGIMALCAAGTFAAVPALANSGNGTSSTPASSSGATHGAFADTNGSFGSTLGPAGGTAGYHGAVGQQPGATGYNNSSVPEPPTITH